MVATFLFLMIVFGRAIVLSIRRAATAFYNDVENPTYWCRVYYYTANLVTFIFLLLKARSVIDWPLYLIFMPQIVSAALIVAVILCYALVVFFTKWVSEPANPMYWGFYISPFTIVTVILIGLKAGGPRDNWSWVLVFSPVIGGVMLVAVPALCVAVTAGLYFTMNTAVTLPAERKKELLKQLVFSVPGLLLVIWLIAYGLECAELPDTRLCDSSMAWYMPLILIVYAYLEILIFRFVAPKRAAAADDDGSVVEARGRSGSVARSDAVVKPLRALDEGFRWLLTDADQEGAIGSEDNKDAAKVVLAKE